MIDKMNHKHLQIDPNKLEDLTQMVRRLNTNFVICEL